MGLPDWSSEASNLRKVSDRTRTGDHLDHNQELYQLSYAHRVASNVQPGRPAGGAQRPVGISDSKNATASASDASGIWV